MTSLEPREQPLPLPAPPRADMRGSAEVQAWLARLQAEEARVGQRNRHLTMALVGGLLMLGMIVIGGYWSVVGEYAVLDDVRIDRHTASQGRVDVAFRVVKPGKVHYRRQSGAVEAELIDRFPRAGEFRRAWSWAYTPGEPLELTLWSRWALWTTKRRESFPTSRQADVVVLIDTTGSMTPSIAQLKEKCVDFSAQLRRQALDHRFALIGFGDAHEERWLDMHPFTADPEKFRAAVARLERFDGGDLPESALDALEEALRLPLNEDALRRFYLVTDAPCHAPSQSGATIAEMAQRLAAARIVLQVFSRPEHRATYAQLLGDVGRFHELDSFGTVLREGRVLED